MTSTELSAFSGVISRAMRDYVSKELLPLRERAAGVAELRSRCEKLEKAADAHRKHLANLEAKFSRLRAELLPNPTSEPQQAAEEQR